MAAAVDDYTLTATHRGMNGDVVRDIRLGNVTVDPEAPHQTLRLRWTLPTASMTATTGLISSVALSVGGEEITLRAASGGSR